MIRGRQQGSEERLAQLEDDVTGSIGSYGSVGAFDVDEDGRLSPNVPGSRLGMKFHWRDRVVSTALRTIEDGSIGIMTLRTQAGRIPSSALAAAGRPDAFGLLRTLPALLPSQWTLTIAPDHSVQLEAEMRVPMPALVSDLLVPAVRFCLIASPYFDLLEENAMGLRA